MPVTPSLNAPIWLCRQDLVDATSTATVVACFDDTQSGQADPGAVVKVIVRAEQRVLSWMVGEYGPPPFDTPTLLQLQADWFLYSAALEYAVAFMFDKHPEYVRAVDKKDVQDRIKRADDMMVRVLESRQRPPSVPKKPANVGGLSVDNGPRLFVDNADGTKNSGDY